jgi:hypothetical protein
MAIACKEIIYSGHAVRRMFQRGLTPAEVRAAITYGEVIAAYIDDVPFPSYLMLHWIKDRPVHVVVAVDKESGLCLVVTAYIPDPSQWQPDFKTRRTS